MSPRKKPLSLCSAGTPMKQLTITESFRNSKSSSQISCKNSQTNAKIRKPRKHKLPPLIPIGEETKKSVNKGTINDSVPTDNQTCEPNVVEFHARKLYYPIGSDSESEQEQELNSNHLTREPRREPKFFMALNKPRLSPKNLNESANSPENTPNKSTNNNLDANESVSSFGSNDSEKTVIYDLDETINSVSQSSKKIQIQSISVFRSEDLNNTSSEEILVQPDIPEMDVSFNSPGIDTNWKSTNGVNKKKLSVVKQLNFNESTFQSSILTKEPIKHGTKAISKVKKLGKFRESKENRMADKLKILRKKLEEIFPSDETLNNANADETNDLSLTPSSVNNLTNHSEVMGTNAKMVRNMCDSKTQNLPSVQETVEEIRRNNSKNSSDLNLTNPSLNNLKNHSEAIGAKEVHTPKKQKMPSDLRKVEWKKSPSKPSLLYIILEKNKNQGENTGLPNQTRNLLSNNSPQVPKSPKKLSLSTKKNLINLSKDQTDSNSNKNIIENQSNNSVGSPQAKTTVAKDDQRPSCSYASPQKNVKERDKDTPSPISSPVASPMKRKFPSSQKPSVAVTPKKAKKNASPIKWDQSPIKNLKAKEGKTLQKKQMQLFVDLIKQVMVPQLNVHHIQLLPIEERKILQKFLALEDRHRYFLIKLFLWKQIWYNIFTFCEKANIEIQEKKDIIEIFDDLKMEGLVLTDFKRTDNMADLLNNLDRGAVRDITKKLTRKEGRNKQENIGILIKYAGTQATLSFSKTFKDLVLDEISKKMGDSVKINPDVYTALSNVYLLATFTNVDFDNIQDYFNAIIHHNVVFPDYMVEPYVIFYSRDEFLKYARSRKSLRELDDFIAKKNKTGILEVGRLAFDQLKITTEEYYLDSSETFIDAPHLKRFTASHVYQGALSLCSEHLFTVEPETVKAWLEYLVDTFPTSQRVGKWYHKLISMHMRQLKPVNYQAAADLLIDVLENKQTNLNEIALMEIGKLAQRIISMKKKKVDQSSHDSLCRLLPRLIDVNSFPEDEFDAEYIETELKGKRNYKLTDAAGTVSITSVENLAIEYYKLGSYPQGSHCEGGLIKALLVLFFWDIIYNPEKHIAGTFLSSLQSYPLDMFTKYFYKNRAHYIQDRLDLIRFKWTKQQLQQFAKKMYENNSHRKSVYGLVMHLIEDVNMIHELLSVIDRKLLADIFQRILKNIRAFSSGMPDLLVWNAEEKTCKFVEVKGHGDRLSTKQELWLEYLRKKGANIAVCYVNSKGSKKTKKVKSIPRNISKEVPEHLNDCRLN